MEYLFFLVLFFVNLYKTWSLFREVLVNGILYNVRVRVYVCMCVDFFNWTSKACIGISDVETVIP